MSDPQSSPESFIVAAPEPKKGFASLWEKMGGGSLSISIIFHTALILLALVWFVGSRLQAPVEQVDFLPGGGGGTNGSDDKISQRKQRAVTQARPAMRIASSAASADAVSLPDLTSSISISAVTSPQMMGGGSAGTGGGRGGGNGTGIGTGNGPGMGPGSGGGFVSLPSIFGQAGGTNGLTGTLYDMKQDRKRRPLEYNGGVPEFFPRLYRIAAERFREGAFKDFYQAKVTLSFTMLAVPNVAAEEGPKAFQAEKEVQPRGWFVHYHGKISPPEEGEWRFAGVFDDALLVYVNNRLVFDGSYDSEGAEDARQEFGTTVVASGRTPFVGKWVRLREGSELDIIIGERPGGRVGGMLLIQQKNKTYEKRADGTPILPVFTLNEPRKEDWQRIKDVGYEMAKEVPVFKFIKER